MSFRREVFQQVGGFRSGIGRIGLRPVGCEETELCIRLNQHQPQGRLLYEPRARVFHRVPRIRSSWRYFVARCYSEGLSKAIVSKFVGADDGLSAERTYTFRTLPRGVAQGVWEAIRRGDAAGLARAGAIITGLLVTTLGFISGKIRQAFPARQAEELPDQTVSGVMH
jgi:hypothetical protein